MAGKKDPYSIVDDIKESMGNLPVPRGPQAFMPYRIKGSPLNKWIKETKGSYQVTRKDVVYIYRNIIFTKTFGELKKIMEDESIREKYPVMVIAIIAGVLGDVARGNNHNIMRMLQFIFPESKLFEAFDTNSPQRQSSYEQIKELEDNLRKLEGDEAIVIVDKLLAEDISGSANNPAS